MRKALIFCSLMLVCCGLVLAKGATRGTVQVFDKAAEIAAMNAEKAADHNQIGNPSRPNGSLDEGGEDCGHAETIGGLPYSDVGNTCEHADNYNLICPYSSTGAPDVAYSYSPASDQNVTINLCGGITNYDTKLEVYEDGVPYACNDDLCNNPPFFSSFYVSRLECLPLHAGHTYCIIVDGYSAFDCGDYTLTLEECVPFQCDCNGQACNETGGFIEDYTTLTTTVFVGSEYEITDVNLCLDLAHTFLADLTITLTSPSGTVVTIWASQCGSNDNMPCVHFDDEAGGYLSCPPVAGQTGWPWGFLSDFDGENAYGTWTLDISDCCGGDVGPLNFWCLHFDYDHILPVTFGSFSALAGDNAIQLNWNTESESANDLFQVVRDGAIVGEVDATNSATGSNYTWVDNSVHNGTTYSYSLVSVAVNGERQQLATVQATPNFSNATVTDYALMQNYPNPFNPETNIAFDLVDGGMVTLNVYNMLGQQVATLVNGSMEAGRHIVSFNAANLPSGLYLYRLEAGEFSAQMKMVLMK